MSPELIDHVAASYSLHAETLRALLGSYMREAMVVPGGANPLRKLPPPAPRAAPRVAASAAPVATPGPSRAEQIYAMASRLRPEAAGGTVLDIGCGSGGTLSAFARHGFQVHGIERDADQRRACRQALGALGAEPVFHDTDLGTGPIPGAMFDVILCVLAIERAADPATMLASIGAMLRPRGVLVLGVANGEAVPNAIADPYHGLFGLTLLARPQAEALFRALAQTERAYDVQAFQPVGRYATLMRGAVGPVQVSPNEDPRSLEAVPELLARLAARFAEAMAAPGLAAPGLVADASLRRDLPLAYAAYLDRVLRRYAQAVETGTAEPFREQFLRKFCHLVAIKQ